MELIIPLMLMLVENFFCKSCFVSCKEYKTGFSKQEMELSFIIQEMELLIPLMLMLEENLFYKSCLSSSK